MGQINAIMTMLQTVSFGEKYFEIALTLREAMLINGMLGSADVWYGLKQKEIENFEEIDKILLHKILDAPSSSCTESLYLELGIIPIRILLKDRRIMYLHYLANMKETEMLHTFFAAQWAYPCKNDWTTQVREDLKEFGMSEDLQYLKEKSVYQFKRIVKAKMKENALNYLFSLKEKHSKMDDLCYTELKLQKYLKSDRIPVREAKNLYRYRVKVANFKANFGERYQSKGCPFCFVHLDTQPHAMQCVNVKDLVNTEGDYRKIFGENIPSNISKTLLNISKMRENLI